MENVHCFFETCCSSLEAHVRVCAIDPAEPRPGLIITHPWCRLGGSMRDPTVVAIFNEAASSGAFGHVVRYNVRAAGRSSAKRCRCADPDASDLAAVMRQLLQTLDPPPCRLYACGYSYGSCILGRALPHAPEVAGVVLVAPPLGFWSNMLLGSQAAWRQLGASRAPKLAVSGDCDTFTSLETLREAVRQHNAALARDGSPRGARTDEEGSAAGAMHLSVLQGADHFFLERWDEVAHAVVSWLLQVERQHS